MSITDARRIIVSEAIDETDLRMPQQNGLDVDDRDILDVDGRNDFQLIQKWFELGRDVGLQSANHNVLPPFFAPPPLVKHAKGFADSRSVSKKHFEAASCGEWCY